MPLLFVENLTAIDCSILDPDRGLIGASWSVGIELGGALDEQSMLFDFSKVKRTIKAIIDAEVDHKLLVPLGFSGLSLSGQRQLKINFTSRAGELITHNSPASAICTIDAEQIDANIVSEFLQTMIKPALPSNITQLNISLECEQAEGSYYCYSHGLKKHDGNCQRIAHGHRSLIQIWKDEQRAPQLEQWLSRKWEDIYLGSNEDVIEQDSQRVLFRYRAEHGEFELQLAANRVHLMDEDSTVECIAEHILELVQNREPSAKLKIKAFEGMNKGAIARSKEPSA